MGTRGKHMLGSIARTIYFFAKNETLHTYIQ